MWRVFATICMGLMIFIFLIVMLVMLAEQSKVKYRVVQHKPTADSGLICQDPR